MDTKYWWLESRRLTQTLKDVTKKTSQAAETLFHARTGNPLEKGLAYMSLVGMALDALIPSTFVEGKLESMGWNCVSNDNLIAEFILDQLNGFAPPRVIDLGSKGAHEEGVTLEILVWDEAKEPFIIGIRRYGDTEIWERVPGAVRGRIQDRFWQNHSKTLTVHGLRWEREGDSVEFTPLRSSGAYVGADMADRVREAFTPQEGKGCRVVLLIGPTGVGKTTLSCTALGEDTTVLKIPKPTDVRSSAAIELLQVLRPQVVLLDDIPLPKSTMSHQLTQLLDDLNDIVDLIVCTFMDDGIVSEDQLTPGVFYYPGMRSGRVDEILFLAPPDQEGREAILKYYGLPEDVAAEVASITRGLTGAFLKEICNRILSRGQSPQDAVRHIRLQAPPAMSGEESDDGGDDEGDGDGDGEGAPSRDIPARAPRRRTLLER